MLRLDQLTVEQKIGRVLCARTPLEPRDTEFVEYLIKNQALGCVQMPIGPHAREEIARLRGMADYPLLVITDMERGYAPAGLPSIPLLSLSAANDPAYTRAFAATIAANARADGYSGCWSPILDIIHEDGPIRISRSAGDTAERVLSVVREFIKVFRSHRFLSAGKHYPGGDSQMMDTHMVEGVSYATEQELMDFELVPYITLMKEGLLDAIMVGHTLYPNIDPDCPASLSPKVIGIIRRLGFDGLVFTDSLAMMGILQKYGEAGAMARALMAGNDIILPNYRTPLEKTYSMMLEAYQNDEITDGALDAAVRRVMRAEQWTAEQPTDPIPAPDNAGEVLDCLGRDCICASCDGGLTPHIGTDGKKLFVLLTEQDYDLTVTAEVSEQKWYNPQKIATAIKNRFREAEIVTLPEFPTSRDNERVLNAATRHSEVVLVSFCDTAAYLGTDGLTRRAESVLNALTLSGKVSAILHYGNPLAIRGLAPIPRKIYALSAAASIIHAVDCLGGIIPPRGKMPLEKLL